MNQFFIYIIESSISVSVFYLFYEFFLKRDTWFRFNRYFLLVGLIFSVALPFLDFSASSLVVNSQNEFEFNEFLTIGPSVNLYEEQTVEAISNPNYVLFTYLIIGSIFLVRFLHQLFKILKTIYANEIVTYRDKKLVLLNNESSPFSFFNYIFITKDDYGSLGSNELLLHEITHARQKHSIDVILLELLLVLQWFNPFIYRYRLAFKEVHEYLADRGVLLANKDEIGYQKLILSQIEKSFCVNLASQFNYSLTKNRIKMMTRINSSKLAKFKILLVLPIVAVLLMAFSMERAVDKTELKSHIQTNSNSVPSIFPVKKVDGVRISWKFGMQTDPFSNKEVMHKGCDIKAPEGTPVYATADGLIRKAEMSQYGWGNNIVIDHEGGYSTLFSHLLEYKVKEGQEVKQGDVIGFVGNTGRSTGPHLHYEVKKDGENVNPEDYF